MQTTDSVKLIAYFTDEVPMRSEALWAQPKDAHEGGGTYEGSAPGLVDTRGLQ